MTGIDPYTLEQAQALTEDALTRMRDTHARWRSLETLYRAGTLVDGPLQPTDVPGQVWQALPSLDLDRVNMILPHVNIILASVVANDPTLICWPIGGGEAAEDAAKIADAVLRYWWKRTRATGDLRDATRDAVITGNGFLKVGWEHLSHEEDVDEADLAASLASLLDADRRLAVLEGGEESPIEALEERVTLTREIVDKDEPFVEYVSPYDVLVPPDARRMWESRWVCQRLVLPVDEIEANPLLEGDVRPDTVLGGMEAHGHMRDREQGDTDGVARVFDSATIYEFYDMRTRRLLVFQIGADEALYDGPIPYSHRYPPFVHIRGYDATGNEFWCFGDVENVAPIQQSLNDVVLELNSNFKRSGNKYLVHEDAATTDLIEALTTDEPDVVAKVKPPNGMPLEEVVVPIQRLPLPADVYAHDDRLIAAMRDVLGINDFQAGGVGADRMSATAAAVVDGVATLRAQSKIAQVEEAAAQTGLLLLLLCQEYLTEPRAIRIVGTEGTAWPEISADYIRGEFTVNVEGGSTKAVNPATRSQRGLQTIQVLIPALQASGYEVEGAWRQALRDLGYDPDQMLVRAAPPAADPAAGAGTTAGSGPSPGGDPLAFTVPQEAFGGPPVPAATAGDLAL